MPAILYPGRLPAAALVDPLPASAPSARAQPKTPAARPAPIWFTTCAEDRLTFTATDRVIGWSAVAPDACRAVPVTFNDSGTGWDKATRALDFQEKTHGGLCVTDALPQSPCFSVGLIYSPSLKGDALTLFSLQAKAEDDYIFVSAQNGEIRFASKRGDQTLSCPDPRKLTLLVLSSDGARVRLAVNRSLAASTACPLPSLPRDVFVGCRGGTRSLLGKLGSFQLTDLMIWPNEDVLAGEVSRAPDTALALWQERQRNGAQT